MSLNPDQLQAVRSLRGPVLVLAGAGSGKTRVVTFRIRELIAHGTAADRILAVTFTNKAAREMLQRTTELLKPRRGAPRPEVSTLHSLCVRILRRHADRLGYPKQFSICDRGDQESFARAALRNIKVDDQKLKPNDFLSLVGGWKSRGLGNEAALAGADGDREQLAALAYERYQEALFARGALDFDDLLLCTERLFTQFADVRKQEAARFDHLMIDEYQDTNASQYRIIRALALRHRNLCVVGDDDQSIYGWRGAEVQHILNFKNDWPEALVIRLETNYRSREPILALANTLIANNSTRHAKVLKPHRSGGAAPRFLRFEDETAEANAVVREIAQKTSSEDEERAPLHDFAILFRTNEQPRAFELELRRAKLRYTLVGGQSFFDRKEVRDMLAYLKLLAFPGDELSLLRVINTPSRGIGASTIKALMEVAISKGKPLGEVLPEAIVAAELPPAIAERIRGFVRLIDGYRERLEREATSVVMRALVTEIDYKAELERTCKAPAEVEARYLAVDGVVRSVEEYEARTEEPTLHGFLEDTALAGRDDLGDNREKQSGVTLMTLHSAKGLEFPHVYMVGMEEGLMPHRRVIAEGNGVEEERRLCYVGVTRAEDTLTLSLCKSRMKWGKARPSIPSRFLLEMRGENEKAAQAAAASEVAIQRDLAQRDLAAEAAAERAADSAEKKKKRRTAAQATAAARAPAGRQPAARQPAAARATVGAPERLSAAATSAAAASAAAASAAAPSAVVRQRAARGATARPSTAAQPPAPSAPSAGPTPRVPTPGAASAALLRASAAAAPRASSSKAEAAARASAAPPLRPSSSSSKAEAAARASAGAPLRAFADAAPLRASTGAPLRPSSSKAEAAARAPAGAPLRASAGAPLRASAGAPLRASAAPLRPSVGAPLRPSGGAPPRPLASKADEAPLRASAEAPPRAPERPPASKADAAARPSAGAPLRASAGALSPSAGALPLPPRDVPQPRR